MAVNTLITIKDALTNFVDQHEQLHRIEFEADDHRAPKIESGDFFPVLFVAPIQVEMVNSMNIHTLRIYVYEKINDNRDDVYENANDTSLILRDIKVWWNNFGDGDIQIIGDQSGDFLSDRELDNLVGYMCDFRFEIPAHGRCDVPITPIPPFAPTCQPATYIVQYDNGTLIEQGTIPSGGSVTVEVPNPTTCQDANYTLTDSLGNVLDSGTIASGGSATITAPDATFTISNTLGDLIDTGSILSGGNENVIAPDGTNNINKSNGVLIQSVSIPSDANIATDIADSVITLNNTEATTLSTTNVLATDSATITAPDGTVNVNQSDGTLIQAVTAPSGGVEPYNVADSVITVNSDAYTDLLATDSLNIPIVDTNGDAVATTVVGSNVQVDDLPCAGGGSVGATLMKTGQTTSFRTGDDGDLQVGRDVDFFTLPSDNPFGNTQRFTGTTGGYYDGGTSNFKDVNGVVTTYTLAFPDDIMIDWTTFNGTTFLMYHIENHLADGVNGLIATCTAATFGGFSTWRLWNVNEALNLFEWEVTNYYGYEPLLSGNTTTLDFFFTSTGVNSTSNFQIRPAITTVISPVAVGNARRCFPVRTTNISELTI